MKYKITCKEAVQQIVKREETPLSFYDNLLLQVHLKGCPLCQRFNSQNQLMNKSYKEINEMHSLSEEEKKSIADKIRKAD